MTTSSCEALRRDGTRCPHTWKHCLLTSIRKPGDQQRHVYLCGQHKNALGKAVMAVTLVTDPGFDAFVSEDRDGKFFYTRYEVTS